MLDRHFTILVPCSIFKNMTYSGNIETFNHYLDPRSAHLFPTVSSGQTAEISSCARSSNQIHAPLPLATFMSASSAPVASCPPPSTPEWFSTPQVAMEDGGRTLETVFTLKDHELTPFFELQRLDNEARRGSVHWKVFEQNKTSLLL